MLDAWQNRRDSNLNKLRYFVRGNWIGAKINRFNHAMDPDRGILTFISFLFSEEKDIYGIYSLVRPRGNELMRKELDSLNIMRAKLDTALDEMDRNSLPTWLVEAIKQTAQKATLLNEEIDFQDVWEEHIDRITDSKVVMTLAYFLDGLYLNHNGIKLKWDRRRLLQTSNKDFFKVFAMHFNFANYTSPTPLLLVTDTVNEDEISYTLVHKILRPNGFNIVSVSYPGAQGSMAVLPQPELGKAQPRKYIDVIAVPPAISNIDVLLNESKGMFNLSEIKKDVDKVMLYKTSQTHQDALKEALVVAQVIDENKEVKNIVVGVSFGLKSQTRTTWVVDRVDFIMRIVDRSHWAIGIFNQDLADVIHTIEGNTSFPVIWTCDIHNS